MKLEERLTISVKIGGVTVIGNGPAGFRQFIEVSSGTIKGEGLDAELTSGGDWPTVAADGYARADIRYTAVTADGATLYVQGSGLIQLNEATDAALRDGQASEFDDQYLRIVFTFETADERYAWLNTTLFVGAGRFREGGAIEYAVSAVR